MSNGSNPGPKPLQYCTVAYLRSATGSASASAVSQCVQVQVFLPLAVHWQFTQAGKLATGTGNLNHWQPRPALRVSVPKCPGARDSSFCAAKISPRDHPPRGPNLLPVLLYRTTIIFILILPKLRFKQNRYRYCLTVIPYRIEGAKRCIGSVRVAPDSSRRLAACRTDKIDQAWPGQIIIGNPTPRSY